MLSSSPSEGQWDGRTPEKPSAAGAEATERTPDSPSGPDPGRPASLLTIDCRRGSSSSLGRAHLRPTDYRFPTGNTTGEHAASPSQTQRQPQRSSDTPRISGMVAAESADSAALNEGGSIPVTPRMGSSALSSPLLSSSVTPGGPQSSSYLQQASQHRGNRQATRTTGTPLTSTSASASGAGGSPDYVDVVVRLKPPQKRVADAYMNYSIEAGSLPTPPRTGRRGFGERSPGPSARTPRTARLAVDGASPMSSARDPRTAHNNGTPTQPSHSPVGGGPLSSSRLATNTGATGTVLTLHCPAKPTNSPLTGSSPSEERRSYEFGQVLDCSVSDAEMCQRIVPGILEQLSGGYNVCVLCYGQTGSGKTHTISALAPFLTRAIFESAAGESDVVELSYIQIYNDRAYDLLGRAAAREDYGVPLPRPVGSIVCEPKVFARTAVDVMARIAAAQKYRCTGTHRLNARSSRSHTLLSLHITRCLDGVPVATRRVTLADLAGSERVKRTGAQGDELTEAIHINKSLHTLHSLIIATAADSGVLPYRESLLTRYLAPRLKEWHIVLIVTASLAKSNVMETKSSLDFALTAKRCVVTKHKARATDRAISAVSLASDSEELCAHLQAVVAALQQRVEDLQSELAVRQDMAALPAAIVADREKEMESLRTLLLERESDLRALREQMQLQQQQQQQQQPQLQEQPRCGDDEDHVAALLDEVAARHTSREDALELLAQLRTLMPPFSPTAAPDFASSANGSSDARLRPTAEAAGDAAEIIDGLNEAFLWSHARLDAVCEQYRVLHQAIQGLRADNGRLKSEMHEQRRQMAAREAEMAAWEAASQRRYEQARSDLMASQDRNADYLLSLTKHVVRSEMSELYGVPRSASGGIAWAVLSGVGAASEDATSNGKPARAEREAQSQEQRENYEIMAAELAATTRSLGQLQAEFDNKKRSRAKLEMDLERCYSILLSFWNALSPGIKEKLLSQCDGAGNGDWMPSAATVSNMSVNIRPRGGLSQSCIAGTSVPQGLAVVQLKSRLQELEQQLSSTQAKASDAEKELEEQQRMIEGLRQENAKVAGVMSNWMELMKEHEHALTNAEADRSRLNEVIDVLRCKIFESSLALEREENIKSEAQRNTEMLREHNTTLQKRIEAMERQSKKSEAHLRTQERDAAEHLRATEEAYKAKILQLEWRLQQLADSLAKGDTGGGGLRGGYISAAGKPSTLPMNHVAKDHTPRSALKADGGASRARSDAVVATPNVIGKRSSRGRTSSAGGYPVGTAAKHTSVVVRTGSTDNAFPRHSTTQSSWLSKREAAFNATGTTAPGYDSLRSSHNDANGFANRLTTASNSTAPPGATPRGRAKRATREPSLGTKKKKQPAVGLKAKKAKTKGRGTSR